MELTPNINTGVKIELRPTDWIAGAETGLEYAIRIANGDWGPYLPTDERQHFRVFDTLACVTFSGLNSVEAQIKWLIATNRIPQWIIDVLKQRGYFDENGNFNCSDRYNAKLAQTDIKRGNWPGPVWDSFRDYGILPEKDWPTREDMTFEEYYAEIPQALIDKARLILPLLSFAYEWVVVNQTVGTPTEIIKKHIKQAPLQVCGPTCPPWAAGVIQNCGSITPNHATLVYAAAEPNYFADFDHYDPYRKQLAWNYCLPWVFKGVVDINPTALLDVPELEIEWKPSPNFTVGRGQWKPEAIVIHITTGSIGSAEDDMQEENAGSADNTFLNPASRVSAHFTVGKRGQIHQYVKVENQAWHAGVVSNPSWTGIKPLTIANPNAYTIGIEHEGTQYDVWPEEQRQSSALLIRSLAKRWGIPLDRQHIIGHYQIRHLKPDCPAVDKSIIDELILRAKGEPVKPKFVYNFKVNLYLNAPKSFEVRKLQEALQYLGYLKPGVFGPYGPQTRDAVNRFQIAHAIKDTGKGANFGPKTRAAMNAELLK